MSVAIPPNRHDKMLGLVSKIEPYLLLGCHNRFDLHRSGKGGRHDRFPEERKSAQGRKLASEWFRIAVTAIYADGPTAVVQ